MKTNLKKIRKAAGWSNADDFAAHIGIPAKTYRNYEQGVRNMGMDVACEICNALGCTIDDLVDSRFEYAVVELPKVEEVDPDELRLVEYYRDMAPEQRKMLMDMARMFAVMNDPKSIWTGPDGIVRTAAEMRGLQ